jgi:6-phosphogluconate dehydrogenase
MHLGMVGLGRMGSNLVKRLMAAGHQCAVYDLEPEAVAGLVAEGATGAGSLADLVGSLSPPRVVWIMIPAEFVDQAVEGLVPLLEEGDFVVDGGNSHFEDDLRRYRDLAAAGIRYLDVGTSGGVHGLHRGFCLMVGGDRTSFDYLEPIWRSLAPDPMWIPRTGDPQGPPRPGEAGYLYCGPPGAGHFVKMVHNGIEYGIMAAYAEGLAILERGGLGLAESSGTGVPLRKPERYRFDFDLPGVVEVWRRGSVITSWLLDLTAEALAADPDLAGYSGTVSDSGEGRWTVQAAVDLGVPAPVIAAALYQRFSSRDQGDFADRTLSAMRYQFGGHRELPAGG